MSTLAAPPVRDAAIVEPLLLPRAEPEPEGPASPAAHRWEFFLVPAFVLAAFFFALALALNEQWPMVPAFLLGWLPLILGYIYLSLSGDSNAE